MLDFPEPRRRAARLALPSVPGLDYYTPAAALAPLHTPHPAPEPLPRPETEALAQLFAYWAED